MRVTRVPHEVSATLSVCKKATRESRRGTEGPSRCSGRRGVASFEHSDFRPKTKLDADSISEMSRPSCVGPGESRFYSFRKYSNIPTSRGKHLESYTIRVYVPEAGVVTLPKLKSLTKTRISPFEETASSRWLGQTSTIVELN